jgi:hypothetical protein
VNVCLEGGTEYDIAVYELYGLDSDGSEYIIDRNTAAVTLVGNTGGQVWLDMTIPQTAVPEPSTIGLLGIGLLGVATRLRRLF